MCDKKKLITGTNTKDLLEPVIGYFERYQSYYILGLSGDDIIIGGPNNDCFEGGEGKDKFMINEFLPYDCSWFEPCSKSMGNDVILDFTPGEDLIVINPIFYRSVSDIINHSYNNNRDNVVIPFGYTGTIELVGITKEQLLDEFFEFAA